MRFVHDSHGVRVLFGAGRRHELADVVAATADRPLVVIDAAARTATPDVADTAAGLAAAVIDDVRQHVPLERARAARDRAAAVGAECVVAIGGGSAIGLAKAVALTTGLPIIAVPTTYAGSELTPVWGITDQAVKTTGRDPVVAPRVVLYDPELTFSLPPALTASSGLNAVAHCVDGFWAPGRTPLSEATGERGISLLAQGLPACVADPRDADGRAVALAGAWLAGATFAVAGSSLHHKLCHLLGGRYDLPHAQTHAVLLPLVAELAVRHVPAAGTAIARALGVDDPIAGLRALGAELGAPVSLAEHGLTAPMALAAAETVDVDALATPFFVGLADIRTILLAAAGDPGSPTPRSDAP